MLLSRDDINFLKESDSGDIAGVDNVLDLDKRTYIEENEEEIRVTKDNEIETRLELKEILNELEIEELNFIKEVIIENLPDFCINFQNSFKNPEPENDTIQKQFLYLIETCCIEDLELLAECFFYVLSEIDDFTDFAYGDLQERLINPQHIRKLKLLKKKAQWKMDAKKRARFRRTGEGRIMKRKAKIYQKRYRRRKVQKLKRYGKEYAKYTATHQ